MRCLPHRGVVEALRRSRHGARTARVRRFAGGTRGSAGIELAIGASVVLGIAATSFAVYSRIEAATSAPRIAIAMAEYVSQERAPDGDQLDALALFLRDHELGAGYALVVATTAVHKAAGESAGVVWIDRIALGDDQDDQTVTEELKGTCRGKGAAGGKAALGDHFAMADGETVFVVEVCARATAAASLPASWAGDLYAQYLLPTRHPDVIPEQPARTPGDGDSSA